MPLIPFDASSALHYNVFMKALVAAWCSCLLLAGVTMLFSARSMAEEAPSIPAPAEPEPVLFDLHTLSGEVYTNSRVIKVTPADLTVMHENGVARIPFEKLSVDWQNKYQFDPAKAEEYRRIQLSIQRDAEEDQRKLRAERTKAEEKVMKELEDSQKRLAKSNQPAPPLAPMPGEDNKMSASQKSATNHKDPFTTLAPIGPVHESGISRSRIRSSKWRYSEGIYSVDGYAPPYIWSYGSGYMYSPNWHHQHHHDHHHGHGHHHGHSGIFISPPIIRITR